jgi:chromosomal replication initiator protein
MLDTIWTEARRLLRVELPANDYATWIAPLRAARWLADELTIEVPNVFTRDWLQRNFLTALEQAASAAAGRPVSVAFLVNRALEPGMRRAAAPAHVAGAGASAPPRPAATAGRYTFDNFVVGGSNQVAYGAARAVVAQPGQRFNPLFVWGGCGLGKTHLLNAVAHATAHERRHGSVACLSAENFVNEMIVAIRQHQMDRFRRRFRGIDTLVVDDIQFLAGKRRSQEEFYHTFNALHDGRKQIVVASDAPPHALPGIDDQLRSRFASGLLSEIQPPDAALRLALARSKITALGLQLHPEVVEYVATEWCATVRELEGALARLELYASLTGRAVDLGLAREALGASPAQRARRPSVERVIGEVCEQFQLSRAELASPRRTAKIALPRQLAMYLCRQHTDAPLGQIGERLGGRDHSTVHHALQAIERRLANDASLRQTLSKLRARLGA